MNETTIKVQIHRFGDQVAISLHDGSTVYISAACALELSCALVQVSRSVYTTSFSKSTGTTHAFSFNGKA